MESNRRVVGGGPRAFFAKTYLDIYRSFPPFRFPHRLMHNESVQSSLETMKDQVAMVEATRIAKDEMHKALGMKELDIDKIYDLQVRCAVT